MHMQSHMICIHECPMTYANHGTIVARIMVQYKYPVLVLETSMHSAVLSHTVLLSTSTRSAVTRTYVQT